MKLRILALGIVVLEAIIAYLNIYAIQHSLYWAISWFDILMHGLGGLFIGLTILLILLYRGVSMRWGTWLGIVGGTIAVGVLWEIIEVSSGLYQTETNVFADTILDLIMDTLGGMVAGFIGFAIGRTAKQRTV